MGRPTLLYASPFPPERSGVADYSEALVHGLRGRFELTLLAQLERPALRGPEPPLPVRVPGRDDVHPEAFDHVVYNLGNNPYFHSFIYDIFLRHPGPVILHDVALYFLMVGYYRDSGRLYDKVYELAGPAGVRIVKDQVKEGRDLLRFTEPALLPLNGEVLRRSPLILVHSRFARRAVLQAQPDATVRVLPMVDPYSALPAAEGDTSLLRERFGIPDDAPVVASFGLIAPTKQNLPICRAMARLAADPAIDPFYVMVGEGDDVDAALGPRVIKTGYLPPEQYTAVLDRCDLVASLRHPTMGETSLGLIQALSRGKACLVTDEAWFSELPDDVVIKVASDTGDGALADIMARTLRDADGRVARGARAREYIRAHHRVEAVTRQLADYLAGQSYPALPGGSPFQPMTA